MTPMTPIYSIKHQMVKLPALSHKVVQTSSETTSEGHVSSAVDECEKNRPTSLLVCVRCLAALSACTAEMLNKTTAYLSDAQREELGLLYQDAWAAMPASKRAQSSAAKLREALCDAQLLLTAARTARANVNIAAGVQFDMSVFLSSRIEGRSDWVLVSRTD
jgi:hypothetical protein